MLVRLVSLVIILASTTVTTRSSAQSFSMISEFLGQAASGPVTMSADGKWIAFLPNTPTSCLPSHELALISPHGDDFRVILEDWELSALQPGAQFPYRLSLTGDGGQVYWWWFDSTIISSCTDLSPTHTWRADTMTGAAEELFFAGERIGALSHSDDGQVLVFAGWNAATRNYHWYVSGPDTSLAVEFLDPTPWHATFGKVCGDGSKFVMIGYDPVGFPDYPGDVYVYDFASARLSVVSPFPVEFLHGLDISGDGGRIVYAGSSPIYGVASDGSDFHVVHPAASGGSATITRDGSWIVHVFDDPGGGALYKTHRTTWDGSQSDILEGWTPSGLKLFHSPTNADGTVIPMLTPPGGGGALAVWFEQAPVLTTFGYGLPGTFIRWDIGGEPGGTFLLIYAFAPASIPLGTKGTLLLDPASLRVLVAGTIGGPPQNIGTLKLTIPPGAVIPVPFGLHSQALVWDARGHNGTLTNSTILEIGGAVAATAGGQDDGGGARLGGDATGGAGQPQSPHPALSPFHLDDPEERERWLALMDPNYALRLEGRWPVSR